MNMKITESVHMRARVANVRQIMLAQFFYYAMKPQRLKIAV